MASNTSNGLTAEDKIIRHKVQNQRGRIVQLLIPTDMLSYSLTLRDELKDKNVERIKAISDTKGITEAAEEFIKCLEKSESSGIWTAFKDVLRNEGYNRLLNMLDGTDNIFYEGLIRVAQSHANFDPISVLDRLRADNVIEQRHAEIIKANCNGRGEGEATAVFFDYLRRSKSPDWYRHFMLALKEKGLIELMHEIDPDFWSREKLGGNMDGAVAIETDQRKVNNLNTRESSPKGSTCKSLGDLGEYNVQFSENPPKDDQAAFSDESTDPKEELQTSGTDISNLTELSSDSVVASKPCEDICLADYMTEESWKENLREEFESGYFKKLQKTLTVQYRAKKKIYPPKENIFNAFNLTPLNKVKVVIVGLEPYHNDGQADGLSFSGSWGVRPPQSLLKIFKEHETDIPGVRISHYGCLERWAKEGVLLLNAILTVEADKSKSHANYGWQKFTDNVISLINRKREGVVFVFLDNIAQKTEKLINQSRHTVVKASNRSPFSACRFYGYKCFVATNNVLVKAGKSPVNWFV